MPTVDFAARAVYKTYKNGSVDSVSSEARRIGYSNTSGTNKYVTVYKFTMPVVNGTITAINLTPYVGTAGYAVSTNKTWRVGIAQCSTATFESNASFASLTGGVGDVACYYSATFSNGSTSIPASGGSDINCGTKTISINSTVSIKFSTSSSTNYMYLVVNSGTTNAANLCKITSLQGTITYSNPSYTANHYTDTYATSSASPASGTSGTKITFSASSNANTYQYIYGDLKLYVSGAGSSWGNPVKTVSGYANGAGARLSTSYSTTFGSGGLDYKATASRYTADPGGVTCTVTNITTNSARINVPTGVTTTFLNSYYYLSSSNYTYTASSSNLNDLKTFSRSTGYVNLTGLSASTSYTRYVYVYNSYNGYYYKIGSVSFTTHTADASSYSATIIGKATGQKSGYFSISNLSPTTNLDSNWYLSTTNSATASSLADMQYSSRSSNISLSGLSIGSTVARYAYVKSTETGTYYRVGNALFTTDASYSASIFASGITATSALVSMSGLSSTTNLDGNWYISMTNSATATSLTDACVGSTTMKIQLSDLSPETTHTRYAYVKSSATVIYYNVGSVTFNTHAYIYYADGSGNLIPCWTYMQDEGSGALRKILLNVPQYRQ